jgi:hypothetical protein
MDLYKVAQQLLNLSRVNKQFRGFIEQFPEYEFFKYMPRLTRIVKNLIPADFLSGGSVAWDRERAKKLLDTLKRLTPEFGPSLIRLLSPKMRLEFVKLVDGIPNKFSRSLAIAYLINAREYLKNSEFEKFMEELDSAEALDINKFVEEVILHEEPGNTTPYRWISVFIKTQIVAIPYQPSLDLLKPFFNLAKNIPEFNSKIIALDGLFHAIKFLSQEERSELFKLTMEIANTETTGNGNLTENNLNLLITATRNTRFLNTTALNTLIKFIMAYEGRAGYAELLSSLAEVALQGDEQLRSELTNNIKKWNKIDTLNGCVHRVLQIDPLSSRNSHLVARLLNINDQKKRGYMLNLLCHRMKYLSLEDRKKILEAVLRGPIDDLIKIKALRRLVANIAYVDEADRYRILVAIEENSSSPDEIAKTFSVFVNALSKKLARSP